MDSAGLHKIRTDEAIEGRISFVESPSAYFCRTVQEKVVVRERNCGLHGGGLHSWQRFKPLQQTCFCLPGNFRIYMLVFRHKDKRSYAARVKPWLYILQGMDGPHEETACRQQHASQCNL